MGLPSLRTVFDKVERAVGAPLEDAVASPKYGTAVSFWVKGPAAVNRAVRRKVDDGLAGVLHALNVPARDDVQRLSRQVAVLTAEVRALSLPTERISTYVEQRQEREAELGASTRPASLSEARSAQGAVAPSPTRAIGSGDGA